MPGTIDGGDSLGDVRVVTVQVRVFQVRRSVAPLDPFGDEDELPVPRWNAIVCVERHMTVPGVPNVPRYTHLDIDGQIISRRRIFHEEDLHACPTGYFIEDEVPLLKDTPCSALHRHERLQVFACFRSADLVMAAIRQSVKNADGLFSIAIVSCTLECMTKV